MSKRKPSVSGGVEGMLDAIHERIDRECAERGEVWCHRWGHPSRVPGVTCKRCVHQLCLTIAFWRTMGVRERDMP